MTDMRPEGMRALRAEREENRQLRMQLTNLRAEVIAATNHLVDVIERDGGIRKVRKNV